MPKKQKQESKQTIDIKQDDSTTQKVISYIARIFIGQKNIEKQINRAVISNTYYFILQIIHTVLLFAVFNKSNSATYSVTQSAIGGYFSIVYLIPRISKKHLIFQITFILYFIGFVGSGLSLIILFKYFYIFSFYCSDIKAFYAKKGKAQYLSRSICQSVYKMYIIELIVEMIILGLRVLYLLLCFRAYMIARQKFDEQQKKKRRRDRYNQLLLKRTMYNDKRKV